MYIKTYKYRLYPTNKQVGTLRWTLDRCRELYNAALQERRDAWKMCKVSINLAGQSAQLPEIKEIREEYTSLYSQILQDVLRRVDKAYKSFFRRVKNGEKPGYPRFQGKDRYDSFTYPQVGSNGKWGWYGPRIEGSKLILPKLGHIKIKLHRQIEGKIKTCTIKWDGQHWYATFSCEVEQTITSPFTDEAIGIDLGLLHFATLSTSDTIEKPPHFRKGQADLRRKQRHLSRCKRSSHRREKARKAVAKTHRKIKNQRHDFLHKASRQLVNTYKVIVFEDLASSNMSKRPKPKQDEETGHYLPNGASAKSGLNKSIRDAGWSTFVMYCQSKAECAGTVTIAKVDPYKTSQICSQCGKEGPHKDLSERTHTCIYCGVVLDRDHNAALNVLSAWKTPTVRTRLRGKRECTVEASILG